MAQGSRRGFSKENKQGQVSRKGTWGECCLGSQEVDSSKKERRAKMFRIANENNENENKVVGAEN